jgi:hypothetical protein
MIKNHYIFKIFLLLAALSMVQACTKDRQVLFDIPMQVQFEIPAGLSPFQTHFQLITNVPTNIDGLKRQFNIAVDQNLVILPESAILSSPLRNHNYDFLVEFGISLYDGIDPEDDAEAFLSDQIPLNAGKNVIIIPFNDDLTHYVDQPVVNLKIWYRTRTITPSFVDSQLVINFTAE